jgi:hypothetical protein
MADLDKVKQSGLLTASLTLRNGTPIQLQGSKAITDFINVQEIDELPQAYIDELLERGAIKQAP